MAGLLGSGLAEAADDIEPFLRILLHIADSTITYRTRYMASPRLGETIDLLVFDQSNPRALAFQWLEIEHYLVRVAASLGGAPDGTLNEGVAAVVEMQLTAVDGDSGRAERARQGLAEQLNQLSVAAGRLSDQLSLKHFSLIDVDIRSVAA